MSILIPRHLAEQLAAEEDAKRQQEAYQANQDEYYEKHHLCPSCHGEPGERTCVGYICVSGDWENFSDENTVWCPCGWKGIVHDLVPGEPK